MLENGLNAARDALLSLQKDDGHWCFPLEADCTIPAEYVLMMHFMDDVDADLEIRLARFIREKQDLEHGGWPLYYGGRLRSELHRKGVLRAQDRGRFSGCASHDAGARSHSQTRRGGAGKRIHSHIARDVWADSLARRSICACGNHSVAAMVSISHQQGRVLVSRGDGTAFHPVQLESARGQPATNTYPGTVYNPPRGRARLFSGAHRSQSAVFGYRARLLRYLSRLFRSHCVATRYEKRNAGPLSALMGIPALAESSRR